MSNFKTNGWNNIIVFGHFPNDFYVKLKSATEKDYTFTYVISNSDDDDTFVEDAVPYHSNTILMNCYDFGNFEESLLKVMSLVYWHPHANLYLYYHSKESREKLALIFFIYWYYKACNVIIIQYDDTDELLFISQYTPYISNVYELEFKYGCWTAKRIGMPIYAFDESFVCEENCHNVSITSKLRATSFGTCIGFVTNVLSYKDTHAIENMNLFEDKGKNFHGFSFRSLATEVLPFLHIEEHPNRTFTLESRDGTIWNTLAKLLNFTIDLSACANVIKKPFNFEVSIQQIFAVAHRKGDLFLIPIYQFDVIVVEIDYTFAYKDSGVCFVSHRAGFETILFDITTLLGNYDILIQFGLIFVCIWFLFCAYSETNLKDIDMNFVGKNFMNSVRSVLLINLSHPPKKTSFRIFLAITVWCFFIINFSAQASIISFFTAFKRGREVDTFEDVVEKGYRIEGMASPDIVLPETEERFRKINSKLSSVLDIISCVKDLSNNSHKFCLVDCSVGRYLKSNMLNEKGEQYIHIAKDRVHSHYLNFMFPKHSVISDNIDKYMMRFFEAGLIKKWEEYRYNVIKEEVLTKPLSLADVKGMFNLYGILVAGIIIIFIGELCVGNHKKFKRFVLNKKINWIRH